MAENEESKIEKKIPVFTVLKNGSILKNIFLLHNPPPLSAQESVATNAKSRNQESRNKEEKEEILFVGRHPNCNITLEHPSISRFHLRIHSNPSSHTLSVIDLSSVHGTWVSGKKIEPGVLVKLKDGDTVRLGGSSRVYELHWVPLSLAYDIDDPFVPSAYKMKDGEEQLHQDENGQLSLDDSESLVLSYSNGNCLLTKQLSSLQDSEASYISSSWEDDIKAENRNHSNTGLEDGEIPCTYVDEEAENEEGGIPCTYPVQENETEDCEIPSTYPVLETEKSDGGIPWYPVQETENEDGGIPCTYPVMVYKLHCVDDPFVPSPYRVKDGEEQIRKEHIYQDENGQCLKKSASQLSVDDFESWNSSCSNENHPSSTEQSSPLAVSMTGYLNSSCDDDIQAEDESPSETSLEVGETSFTYIVQEAENEEGGITTHPVKETESDDAGTPCTCPFHETENEGSGIPSTNLVEETGNVYGAIPCAYPARENENEDALVPCTSLPCTNLVQETEREYSGILSANPVQETANGDAGISCTYLVQETENNPLDLENENLRILGPGAISEVENSSTLHKSEKSNWSWKCNNVVNMADEFELLYQGTMRDELVSEAPFDGNITEEEETSSPDRARDEEFSQGSDFDQMNQKKMKNKLGFVLLSERVDNRVEDDLSTSVVAGKEVDRPVKFESFSQESMQDKSVSDEDKKEVFTPDTSRSTEVHMGNVFKLWSEETMKNESISMSFSDCLDRTKKVHMGDVFKLWSEETMENGSISRAFSDCLDRDDEETFTPDKENMNPNAYPLKFMKKRDKEDLSKHSNLFTMSSTKVVSPAISEEEVSGVFPDEESQDSDLRLENHFAIVEENENVCTPHRENFISKTLLQGSEDKISKFEETMCPEPCNLRSSISSISQEEVLVSAYSDKENQISLVLLPRKSSPMEMEESCTSMNYSQTVETVANPPHKFCGGRKKTWTMVVDANSLLHKDNMKHLKLLQGLPGTQLFVPENVIWQLTETMRQSSLLKSTTDASLALKWVDECIANSRWWINVQSSMEDSQPNARTGALQQDSSRKGSQVLECALHLRREMPDQQVIILSSDLTMKIKAMAEGIVCETAKDFYKSLANPFSERFKWTGSSAIGPTWSFVEDVVLREKYYPSSILRPCGLKGLKLLAFDISPYKSLLCY